MIWSAFVIGLLGSFHCVGMCGPIVLALPVFKDKPFRLLTSRLLYNLGRAITYSLMGMVFGLIGQGISMSGLQQSISVVMGVLIIIVVLIPAKYVQNISLLKPAVGFTGVIKKKFGLFLKNPSLPSFLILGLLNGFLPCGLVYLAIAGAIATGNWLDGGLYMFVFGIGTLPLMFGVALAGNFISLNVRRKVNRFIPVFMVVLGLLFIVRGLNLGIPYLSPKFQDKEISIDAPECH